MPKIFISSTFRDMHFERDALKSKLTPLLSQLLFPYGESVDLIDLRWGVDTSQLEDEESNKKVLKVCLDEIDEAKPYIIVLIGERYGWIPPEALLNETANTKGLHINETDMSITNLEIEYAAFFNEEPNDKILFYFRDEMDDSEMDEFEKIVYKSESPIHKRKLEALKQKIEEKYPNQIRHYKVHYNSKTDTMDDLDDFINQVYKDLEPILLNDVKEENEMSLYERVSKTSHKYFMNYCKDAYETEYVNQCVEFDDDLKEEYPNLPLFTLISGDSGSGRKTTLALKYQKSLQDKDTITVPFVMGLNDDTSSVYDFVDFLADLLIHAVPHVEEIDKFMTSSLAQAMDSFSVTSLNNMNIFIMNADERIIGLIKAFETQMTNISKIAFYLECEDYNDISLPFYKKNNHVVVGHLNNIDKVGIIHSILKRKNKELPENIIDYIALKDGADTPLYITLLIERLLLLDKDDYKKIFTNDNLSLNDYLVQTIEQSGSTIKDLAKELLLTLKAKIDSDVIDRMIGVLSMEKSYFSKREIELLFSYHHWHYDELSLSLFTKLIPNLFTPEAEVYNFFNSDIREAAREISSENYSKYIIDWLLHDENLNDDVFVYTRFRIPWFYIAADDVSNFTTAYIDSVRQYINADTSKSSLDEINTVLTNAFHNVLLNDVVEGKDFAYRVNEEILKRIMLNTIPDIEVIGMYLIAYLECHDDFKNKTKKIVDHCFELIKLYRNAYLQSKNNRGLHAMFLLSANQIGQIHFARAYYNEEEKQIQQELAPILISPEEQAFFRELAVQNEKLSGSLTASSVTSYYDLLGNITYLDPNYLTAITNSLDLMYGVYTKDPRLEPMIESADVFFEDSTSLIFGAVAIQVMLLRMIYNQDFRQEYVDDFQDIIFPILDNILCYIENMDVDWSYETFNMFFIKTIDCFFMYQDTIYEHDEGALEVFYDINERLQTYLLITLDRQPYSVEPLNVLLINSIRGVFILDEEEVGQTLGFINNALATTTDPQLYFGILNFLIAVEHGITDEERNTMFKESIYKVFKAMNELNFIDTEEEKLDLFAQYLAEYIQDRQIEIDDDYVTSLIEEVEPLFKSYDYTDIVDAVYNQLDS